LQKKIQRYFLQSYALPPFPKFMQDVDERGGHDIRNQNFPSVAGKVVCGGQEYSVLVPERFVLCQNILYRAQTKCSFLYTLLKKSYLSIF
jgi:hypothetical protein